MIECSNCESAKGLRITASRLGFDDETTPATIGELTEAYECLTCGATGKYRTTPATGVTISGDIEATENRPTGTVWDLSEPADRSSGYTQPNP